MVRKLATGIMLVVSTTCFAQHQTVNLKYGFGLMQSTQSQMVSAAYQAQLKDSLAWQAECGAWINAPQKGYSSSGFCSYQLGLRVNLPNMYAESMHGVGLISHPDALLGGRFQFFHDFGFGVKDTAGHALGFALKHVSSAGIEKPNIGRNYINIKLSFGF